MDNIHNTVRINGRSVLIRPAQQRDLSKLREFEQGIIAAERPLALDLDVGSITYYDLPKFLASDDTLLLVAECADQLIACGYVRIEKSKPHKKSDFHGYLGFMFVVPEYRRQGINKHIFDTLLAWAKSKQIQVFQLDVYEKNHAAIRAYEKMGFKPNSLSMVLEQPD